MINKEDNVDINCSLYNYYLSSDDSDNDSNEVCIDYTYKSNFMDRTDFFEWKKSVNNQFDDIDDIIRLYEPCNPKYAIKTVSNNKTKNSVWKRFLFLFRRNKNI